MIVTINSVDHSVLTQKTEQIHEDELPLACTIADKLFQALQPYFPAAGLAAPQIGINKALFIYSYDRDPAHLQVVINPTYQPIGNQMVIGWESCLSVMASHGPWKVAKLARYEKIKAHYKNLEGEEVDILLDGFAAKAFQHEYDHLQGIVNIYRKDAEIRVFETKESLFDFMQQVKKEDSLHYKNPS